MSTEELVRSRLRAETDGHAPRPGLLQDVHRGARRRRIRRYAAAGTATVAIVTGVTAVVVAAPHRSAPAATHVIAAGDRALLHGTTQGNRAVDSNRLRDVVRVFDAAARPRYKTSLVGTPHVVWASDTVAAVVQEADLRHWVGAADDRFNGHYLLAGYVRTDTHGKSQIYLPKEFGVYPIDLMPTSFFTDANTLVALDRGSPVQVHLLTVDNRGLPHYTTKPMHSAGTVDTLRLARSAWQKANPIVSSTTGTPYNRPLNAPSTVGLAGTMLGMSAPWMNSKYLTWYLDGRTSRSYDEGCSDVLAVPPANLPGALKDPYSGDKPGDTWCITGTTPDGSTVSATTIQYGQFRSPAAFPAHFVAVLTGNGKAVRVTGGPVADPKHLPWSIRLPDGQGWLVADLNATLRYRIGSGGWLGTAHSVALFPSQATEIQVTANGTTRTVPLR